MSKEFVNAVGDLKQDIRQAAIDATNKFRAETGVTPSHIIVRMSEITAIGDRVKQYAVGDIDIELNM